jgi:hypothetical protein
MPGNLHLARVERLEATARIELAIGILQTPALPLGYVAHLA